MTIYYPFSSRVGSQFIATASGKGKGSGSGSGSITTVFLFRVLGTSVLVSSSNLDQL